MQLPNKNVLITGASRGIGWALAQAFAKKGARLNLVQRSSNESQLALLKTLGASDVKVWHCDLSKPAEVHALATKLATQNIDILVNNAGVLTGELIERQTEEEIMNVFQVNLTTAVLLTKALLPGMLARGQGKIVNNTSVSAVMRFPCATTYAASKAGLLAFTECLENELSGTGVSTLSLLTPGIKTEMFDQIEKSYGKYFDPPKGHISAEEFAEKVVKAIEADQRVLKPRGLTGFGLWLARHVPQAFNKLTTSRFQRK